MSIKKAPVFQRRLIKAL